MVISVIWFILPYYYFYVCFSVFLGWWISALPMHAYKAKAFFYLRSSFLFLFSLFSYKTTMASQPQPRHENAEKSG